MTDPEPGPRPRWWTRPRAWVTTTYFAEGWPYAVVNNLAEVLFTELGASLVVVGLTSIFHLPWNLKFLWGPYIDDYETKRRWLLATEVVLSVLLLVLGFLSTTSALLIAISACFIVLAFVSATHDGAVDGYYLEGLDEDGQARWVGYRAAAYRVATILVLGQLVVAADAFGWFWTFAIAAGVMGLLTLYHLRALPDVETPKLPIRDLVRKLLRPRLLTGAAVLAAIIVLWRTADVQLDFGLKNAMSGIPVLRNLPVGGWIGLTFLVVLAVAILRLPALKRRLAQRNSSYAQSFVHFLEQPRIEAVLLFLLLFRTGESLLQKMRYPFLKAEVGMTLGEYGYINGNIGWGASVAGTLLGGWLIARHGLRRWVWPFVLLQNFLNLLYWWLATHDIPALVGREIVGGIMVAEHFGAGLGTAVFMVYTMRCCDPRHKAANMAVVTSIMSLGFTLAGAISGDLAGSLGFETYFLVTFFITVPSMLLLLVVPHLDGRESRAEQPSE